MLFSLSPSGPWRPFARHLLAMLAFFSTLLAFLTTFSLLAAGTIQLDGGHLLLSRLAPVSFRGVIPTEEIYLHDEIPLGQPNLLQLSGDGTNSTITWQVKFSLFVNAFGFEWPQAPKWYQETGIMRNVNGVLPSSPAVKLPADFATAARYLGLEQDEYDCLLPDPKWRYRCMNPFLQVWNREMLRDFDGEQSEYVSRPWESRQRKFSMSGPSFVFYLTLCSFIGIAAQEGMMRLWPNLFRCRCWKRFRETKWCICWGRDGDGLTLDAKVRNRIRVRIFRTLECQWVVAVVWTMVQAVRVKAFVDGVDRSVGGGMQASMGMGFVGASLAGLGALLVADVCLVVREKLVEEEVRGVTLLDNGEPSEGDEEGCADGEPREEIDDKAVTVTKGRGDQDPLIII